MDETSTDEERARLKSKVISRLRLTYAELRRSHDLHKYEERGQVMMTFPNQRNSFNEDLRALQRAGEDIRDWEIKPPHTVKYRPVKSAPLEDWIDGTSLMYDIKRVLDRIDPQPAD